jgi:hypothetical protein
MKPRLLTSRQIASLQARYQRLQAELASLGWISQGSVTSLRPGTWRWTRKVKAKTVTVALSAHQAPGFRQAIANHRRLETLIDQMRAISQKFLLESIPGPRRRNPPKSS